MARYDAGRGRSPGGSWYDYPYRPFRPYGPPDPAMRPGGYGRAGFNPVAGPSAPGYDAGYGGRGEPWGDIGAGGMEEREEFWEPGTVYGPARYGLGPYHERLRRQRRSDDDLKEEVEEALFFDTWVDADAITVVVDDGIVTLRGELPDFDEIRYATDDAWDVDGVRGVRSELTVRSGERGVRGSASRAAPEEASAGEDGGKASGKGAATGRGRKKPAAS